MSMQITFQDALTQMTQAENDLLEQLERLRSRRAQLTTVMEFLATSSLPNPLQSGAAPDQKHPRPVTQELRETIENPVRSISSLIGKPAGQEAEIKDPANPYDPYEKAMQTLQSGQKQPETDRTTPAAQPGDREKLQQIICRAGSRNAMDQLEVGLETMNGLQQGNSIHWTPETRKKIQHAWDEMEQFNSAFRQEEAEDQDIDPFIFDESYLFNDITPEPATPEPATPEPATPEPATPEPANPEPANPGAETGKPDAISPGFQGALTMKDMIGRIGSATPEIPLIPSEIAERFISMGLSNAGTKKLRYRIGRTMRDNPGLYRNNGDGTYQYTGDPGCPGGPGA